MPILIPSFYVVFNPFKSRFGTVQAVPAALVPLPMSIVADYWLCFFTCNIMIVIHP